MADRKLTVCTGQGKDYATTPKIVLQGKWLKQTGFCVGDKITVECQPDKLTITKREQQHKGENFEQEHT